MDCGMTTTERQEKIRLAKWRSIRSVPKDRDVDLWFSEPGIGYRPNSRWSPQMGRFTWHGSVPGDGEWCICSMPNVKPTHWAEPLRIELGP